MADLDLLTDTAPAPRFESPMETEFIGDTNATTETVIPVVKRGRGRPKGSKNRVQPASGAFHSTRDKKEVQARVANILGGLTGLASVIRPYYGMTDEEANDVAEPLSSYLLRQEAVSSHVREFLDRYDLIAAAMAFAAYFVRVWKDDTIYRANHPKVVDGKSRSVPVRRQAANRNDASSEPEAPGWGYEGDNNAVSTQNPSEFPWVSTPNVAG